MKKPPKHQRNVRRKALRHAVKPVSLATKTPTAASSFNGAYPTGSAYGAVVARASLVTALGPDNANIPLDQITNPKMVRVGIATHLATLALMSMSDRSELMTLRDCEPGSPGEARVIELLKLYTPSDNDIIDQMTNAGTVEAAFDAETAAQG